MARVIPTFGTCDGRKPSGTGGPPKIAVTPFVALSQDAETVAAAKTIGDVLFDDLAYEREFYLIPKDTILVGSGLQIIKPSIGLHLRG